MMRFRKGILLGACGFLLAVSGCKSAGSASNKEGLSAYRAGDYEKAAGLFRQAVTQDKDTAEYHINLGMAMCASGAYEDALKSFQTAASLNPDSVNAYRGIGLARMGQGNYQAAADAFDKAISNLSDKKEEQLCDLLAYHAEASIGNKDYDAAISDYEALLSYEYKPEQIYICLGNVWLKKQNVASALLNYQKSINIDYRNFETYLDMIIQLKEHGYTDEFRTVLNACMAVEPSRAEDYYYRGLIWLEAGEEKEAFSEFEQSYNMGYEEAGCCLGYCYEMRGEYSEAELIYQKELITSEDSARLYNQLALCKMRQEEYTDAKLLLERGLELEDETVRADLIWNQAICYEREKNYQSALEKLEEYRKRYPQDADCAAEISYLNSR